MAVRKKREEVKVEPINHHTSCLIVKELKADINGRVINCKVGERILLNKIEQFILRDYIGAQA